MQQLQPKSWDFPNVFTWRDQKKPQNTSLKVGSVPGKTQTSLFQIKTREVITFIYVSCG